MISDPLAQELQEAQQHHQIHRLALRNTVWYPSGGIHQWFHGWVPWRQYIIILVSPAESLNLNKIHRSLSHTTRTFARHNKKLEDVFAALTKAKLNCKQFHFTHSYHAYIIAMCVHIGLFETPCTIFSQYIDPCQSLHASHIAAKDFEGNFGGSCLQVVSQDAISSVLKSVWTYRSWFDTWVCKALRDKGQEASTL